MGYDDDPEYNALLGAVWGDSMDPLACLALADWLGERGDDLAPAYRYMGACLRRPVQLSEGLVNRMMSDVFGSGALSSLNPMALENSVVARNARDHQGKWYWLSDGADLSFVFRWHVWLAEHRPECVLPASLFGPVDLPRHGFEDRTYAVSWLARALSRRTSGAIVRGAT